MKENSSFAPLSTLEQMTLLKDGGFATICGTSTNGLIWPNLVMDMLLRQVLKSERFQKAIVICVDRSTRHVQQSMMSHFNMANEKLILVDAMGITTGKTSPNVILQKVRSVMNDSELCKGIDCSKDMDEPSLVAIFVYSISAIHLSIGANESIKFLNELNSLVSGKQALSKFPISTQNEVGPTATAGKGICLGVIHSAQHSPREIVASYRVRADVFSTIIVNEGQLADTVAVEVQTLRRASSGRVSEGFDLLAFPNTKTLEEWTPAILVPLPKRKDDVDFEPSDVSESTSAHPDDSIAHVFGKKFTISEPAKVENDTTRQGLGVQQQPSQLTREQVLLAKKNQRIITFSSTDPEFDEDSDPDGDLDL